MNKKKKVVLVAATMSAGKSSIINALVGQEILHSANEATTAKVTRIHIGKFSSSRASAYKHDGALFENTKELSSDLLRNWNGNEAIAEIDVNYAMSARHTKSRFNGITILDTPGANNSVDMSHSETFINTLKANPNSTLVYIINATQLGTTDDAGILKTIRDNHSVEKVVFVLNKVDLLDEELGEKVKNYVQKAKRYLDNLGFSHPIIIPIMTLPALIGEKKLSNEPLGRKERNMLSSELERFRHSPQRLSRAAIIPYGAKCNWQRRMKTIAKTSISQMSKAELRGFTDYCGIQVLKSLISNNR